MVAACEAGKDVYCEKPIGRTIEECNLMVKAAAKYKSVVQVGQWQRSDPHWQDAVNFINSGKLGKIRLVRGLFVPGLSTLKFCLLMSPSAELIMTCGSDRHQNGLSTETASILHSDGSGIMQAA
jgi:hypothetical protein